MAKITVPLTKIDYKKLHLTRGDCLIIKKPKEMNDWDWAQALTRVADDIANDVGVSTVVFGVERSLNEIRKVNEDQMASYGWVRRERVFAFTDEAHEQVAKKYEELAREYHASVTGDEEE